MFKKIIIACLALYLLCGFPAKRHGYVSECLKEGYALENDLYRISFLTHSSIIEADDLTAGDPVTVFYQWGKVTSRDDILFPPL